MNEGVIFAWVAVIFLWVFVISSVTALILSAIFAHAISKNQNGSAYYMIIPWLIFIGMLIFTNLVVFLATSVTIQLL